MNDYLFDFIESLLTKGIIGHKHAPENIIISRVKNLNKYAQREFWNEYENLIREDYFWRLKKRTGRGSDWHISLNPEKLEELKELMKNEI
jgi:hypothetical protein